MLHRQFNKKICLCIEPDLKWFCGKALSSSEFVLKWKEPYLKNRILKTYVVKCVNLNGIEYHPTNNLLDTITSALFINLNPKTVYKCTLTASEVLNVGQRHKDLSVTIMFPPFRTAEQGKSHFEILV